jgi:hypothetical protein
MLVMTLAMGSIAFGVTMPQSINSDKDLKTALKAAKTPEDHARIAAYYRAKADGLDAQATGYEQAAQNLRSGPAVKNISSPTTAAHYEYTAKEFREQAQNTRALAESQGQMARGTVVPSSEVQSAAK